MDFSEFSPLFDTVMGDNGFSWPENGEIKQKFHLLTQRMAQVNQYMNLTAIKEPGAVIALHYADSLTIEPLLPQNASIADIGCGAGFPCLPLALARPDLHITAVDSTEKKIRYVAETATLLGLPTDRLCAVAMRAEEGGAVGGQLREKFNIVVSRAVARLSVLGELALPCLKVGGTLIALKGERAEEEMAEAKGLSVLGAAPARLLPCPLTPPDGGETDRHALVMIEKREKTPKIYPRKYAQMVKKPL